MQSCHLVIGKILKSYKVSTNKLSNPPSMKRGQVNWGQGERFIASCLPTSPPPHSYSLLPTHHLQLRG